MPGNTTQVRPSLSYSPQLLFTLRPLDIKDWWQEVIQYRFTQDSTIAMSFKECNLHAHTITQRIINWPCPSTGPVMTWYTQCPSLLPVCWDWQERGVSLMLLIMPLLSTLHNCLEAGNWAWRVRRWGNRQTCEIYVRGLVNLSFTSWFCPPCMGKQLCIPKHKQ